MGACYDTCYVVELKNTGTTEESISFVDCSGYTQSLTIQPNEISLINVDIDFAVSGNTSENIATSYFEHVTDLYYFSSCCENNEYFCFLATEELFSDNYGLYSDSYIVSDTSEELNYQCTSVFDLESVTSCPPISGNLISIINNYTIYSGDITTNGCVNCVDENPCLTQCYGLLACEGIYDLITSSDPSLSGYVDTYVNIDILTPFPESPTTQFLVKDLGVIDCTQEYTFTYTASTGTCDCQCYRFKTPSDPFITSFVDCDDNLLQVYLPTGKTTNICSKVRPIFNTQTAIPVKLGGLCVNGDCPDLPIVTIEPRNECDVLTIFPMDVSCLVTHPSTPYSFDGEAQLLISGGTPPYTVSWEIGSVAPTIINLSVGNYNATVTDFYNDFEINTTCVLTAETPATTTTTTTAPPLPTYDNLCMFVKYLKPKITVQIQFIFNGYLNGKPNWVSNDSVYDLYWNTGLTPNQWVVSGFQPPTTQVINVNPTTPPITGWQVFGESLISSVFVVSGNCESNQPVEFTYNVTEAKCGNNGTITIQATGGDGVYEYSVDNGITWTTNPIFQNLSAGSYQVHVRDGLGTTTIQTVVVPLAAAPTVNLNLNVNYSLGTFTVTSDVPPGFTVSFDINHTNIFEYYPSNISPLPTYNNIVTVINPSFGPLPQIGITQTQQTPIIVPACGLGPVLKNVEQKQYGTTLTITNGQTINGTFTNQLTQSSAPTTCKGANRSMQITLTNTKVNDCECCVIKTTSLQIGEGSGLVIKA